MGAWIYRSLQNGDIVLNEQNNYIKVPNKYQLAVYEGRIIDGKNGEDLSIFFPIGPGFLNIGPDLCIAPIASLPPMEHYIQN